MKETPASQSRNSGADCIKRVFGCKIVRLGIKVKKMRDVSFPTSRPGPGIIWARDELRIERRKIGAYEIALSKKPLAKVMGRSRKGFDLEVLEPRVGFFALFRDDQNPDTFLCQSLYLSGNMATVSTTRPNSRSWTMMFRCSKLLGNFSQNRQILPCCGTAHCQNRCNSVGLRRVSRWRRCRCRSSDKTSSPGRAFPLITSRMALLSSAHN